MKLLFTLVLLALTSTAFACDIVFVPVLPCIFNVRYDKDCTIDKTIIKETFNREYKGREVIAIRHNMYDNVGSDYYVTVTEPPIKERRTSFFIHK